MGYSYTKMADPIADAMGLMMVPDIPVQRYSINDMHKGDRRREREELENTGLLKMAQSHTKRRKMNDVLIEEEEEEEDADACGACQHLGADVTYLFNSPMNVINRYFAAQWGRMDTEQLCKDLELLYESRIRKPALDQGMYIVEMTWFKWWVHIHDHSLEPRIWIGNTIQTGRRIQANLESKMGMRRLEDEDDDPNIDGEALKSWAKAIKEIVGLYKLDPTKLGYYDERVKLNQNLAFAFPDAQIVQK